MKFYNHLILLPGICLPMMASYPIHLGRPDKVGSALMIQASGTRSLKGKMTVAGQPAPFQDTTTTISLNYRWEVLSANEQRKASKLKLTLGKGSCQKDGVPLLLPTEGTTIEVIREGGKDIFLMDALPLPQSIQDALGVVVELGEGKDEDDLQFGTKTPREVGDSWGVGGEAILNVAGRQASIVGDPRNVVGKSKLESVEIDGGVECLKVSILAEVRDAKGAFFIDKESGMRLVRASMLIDQSGLFPVDPELQPHAYHIHQRLEGTYEGEVGGKDAKVPARADTVFETKVDLRLTPEQGKPPKP